MMEPDQIEARFAGLLDDIEERSAIADAVVDKNYYRLYIATLWANVVLKPDEAGLDPDDLEPLHDYLNLRISTVLGRAETITECFRFVTSRTGEATMNEASLTKNHRELLLYFSSMILDPDGHRRWMEDIESRDAP